MASRVYHYAEDPSRTTSTSTDWSAEKLSLAFTGNPDKRYAIFWSVYADYSAAGTALYVRFRNTTAGSDLDAIQTQLAVATNQRLSCGGMALFDAGPTPVATTFAIQGKSNTTAQTLGLSTAVIFALELTDDDISVDSPAQQTAASTTWQTKCTLSWTPPAAGDYLIIAARLHTRVSGSPQAQSRIYDGATGYRAHLFYWYMNTDQNLMLDVVRATGLSGAQNWSLQHNRGAGSGTCAVTNARMVALRIDGFDAAYFDDDTTERSVNATTYADTQASVTGTPAAVDHFILAGGWGKCSNETSTVVNRVNAGGAAVDTTWAAITASGDYLKWHQMKLREEAGGSTTWKTQFARGAGSGTVYTVDNTIAVLQLEALTGTVSVSASFEAAVQNAEMAALAAAGAVQVGAAASAGLDGAIAGRHTMPSGFDTAIRRALAATASAAPAVQSPRTAPSSLDAAAAAAMAVALGGDGLVGRVASVALAADALTQAMRSATMDLTVYVLQAMVGAAVAVDAAVRCSRLAGLDAAAALQVRRSLAAGIDAVLALAPSLTPLLDLAVLSDRAAATALDAVVHAPPLWVARTPATVNTGWLPRPPGDGGGWTTVAPVAWGDGWSPAIAPAPTPAPTWEAQAPSSPRPWTRHPPANP